MEWGGEEYAALRAVQDLPEPTIDPELTWVWRAWMRLQFDRPYYGGGMGPVMPGRIPFTSVAEWARVEGLSRDRAAFMDHCIMAMDTEFLAWHRERQPKPPARR